MDNQEREVFIATDDQVLHAVMAFTQAGKRGCDLREAIKCAVEAAAPSAAPAQPEPAGEDKRDAELWRALMKDTDAQPCAYPCLRDGLADWMRSRTTQGDGK